MFYDNTIFENYIYYLLNFIYNKDKNTLKIIFIKQFNHKIDMKDLVLQNKYKKSLVVDKNQYVQLNKKLDSFHVVLFILNIKSITKIIYNLYV